MHQNRLLSIHEIDKREARERCIVGGTYNFFQSLLNCEEIEKRELLLFTFPLLSLLQIKKYLFVIFVFHS
jgi:hypothetical protein